MASCPVSREFKYERHVLNVRFYRYMKREQIAQDTLDILKRGSYKSPGGYTIEIAADLKFCVENTHCYVPEELDALKAQILEKPAPFSSTTFEVTGESTLRGSARLAAAMGTARIAVLNFASARHPGGGFLSGAHAQEESLARSSGLYRSLTRCSSYYQYHNTHRDLLYSDRVIYSALCPVFRQDDGRLLEQTYRVDFLASPAPNAGAIWQSEPENAPKIEAVLRERASKILSVAASQSCSVLVLGAWGCGVFRNNPVQVATIFRDQLGPGGPFWKRFTHVLFAVLDTTVGRRIYQPFAEMFTSLP